MGIFSSKLNTNKLLYVEVKPYYKEGKNKNDIGMKKYNGKIQKNKIKIFFKTNKFNKKYLFDLEGYKFNLKNLEFKNTKVIYLIKYSKINNNTDDISINKIKYLFEEGFHKTTNSGDPHFLTKIKNKKIYIFVDSKDVKVYQK
jgi:hypothetical protein